jgi:hypothetical protein
MSQRKPRTRTNFSNLSRNNGLIAGKKTQKANAINDGLTPTQRRTEKIKKAANGCWWIEQYIIGTISYARNLNGIDDE